MRVEPRRGMLDILLLPALHVVDIAREAPAHVPDPILLLLRASRFGQHTHERVPRAFLVHVPRIIGPELPLKPFVERVGVIRAPVSGFFVFALGRRRGKVEVLGFSFGFDLGLFLFRVLCLEYGFFALAPFGGYRGICLS